jgi:hypothetical protein
MKPSTPETVLAEVIVPALALLPARMDTPQARLLMLAICGQEAAFKARRQTRGPARGLWQFEKLGGVAGVMSNAATAVLAEQICEKRGLTHNPGYTKVYTALETDDILAACFARLLLWSDPKPIPLPFQGEATQDAMWDYYKRNWRPGKPHPDRWPGNYAKAWNAVFAK